MNNTEEFWSIGPNGGVSLHQYGWSVTTVGGSRYDLPPRRGSNLSLAYRPGQVHRNKLPDSRTITLLMFMVGADPGTGPAIGSNPTLADQRVQWNDNWDFLRRLVYEHNLTDGRVLLTRRWRLTAPVFPTARVGNGIIAAAPGTLPWNGIIAGDPGTPPSGVSSLITASAYAEMSGNMAPTMTGRTRSDFQMDFTLADPFFYGLGVDTTIAHNTLAYVWNPGHDVANYQGLTVDLNGPLTHPTLTNLSTNPASSVTFNGSISGGNTLSLNIGAFTARAHATGVTSPAVNRIAGVSNSGARMWFNLLPGANKIQLTTSTSSDTGTALLHFLPPYV